MPVKKHLLAAVAAGLIVSLGSSISTIAAEGTWDSNVLGWWYQYEDGTYPQNAWAEINGCRYFFDRDGYMVTGWVIIEGTQYCFAKTGELSAGWCYNESKDRWFYYNEDGMFQKGWMYEDGNWYWFSYYGEMAEGGYKTIDGKRYYFFNDGRMAANQYVGLEYIDEDGNRDSRYDIVLEGREKNISKEEKDDITEALKNIPRGWIRYFNENGWKMMYYTDKSYFSAPDTEEGVYYVYHKLDTSYKKLKFTDPYSLTKAFGEYIGYVSGCYEENNSYGIELKSQQHLLLSSVYIPGFFDGDMKFFFGQLTQAYLGWDTKDGVKSASETAYEIMTQIMYCKEENL